MSDESRLSRRVEVAWRIIEGEAVLIHPAKGRTLVLNGAGASIWSWLENATEAELAGRMCAKYDVSAEQALEDVRKYLADLRREDLITTSP